MIITGRAIVILISLLVLAGAGIYLSSHKVAAPQTRTEKVISNDRFFK